MLGIQVADVKPTLRCPTKHKPHEAAGEMNEGEPATLQTVCSDTVVQHEVSLQLTFFCTFDSSTNQGDHQNKILHCKDFGVSLLDMFAALLCKTISHTVFEENQTNNSPVLLTPKEHLIHSVVFWYAMPTGKTKQKTSSDSD